MELEKLLNVAPRVGAWIETAYYRSPCHRLVVAPRVGAWIETSDEPEVTMRVRSHPVWVRGLKPRQVCQVWPFQWVAPRVGAWIETYYKNFIFNVANVAPRVGAWIETEARTKLKT